MIKSLHIKNFQSHKDTFIELSPNVNVFIGVSDAGKSAIMRALRKVVWNRPLGNPFRSWWGGKTLVKLITNDNDKIAWSDGDEKLYRLNSTKFEAFKTEVPDEIKTVLNIDEINLQRQLDEPFLLTKSPGEVAQHFNRITNLDKIGTGQSNIQKWINQLNSSITSKEKDLKDNKEQLIKYDYLEKAEAEIEVLEGLDKDRKWKEVLINKMWVAREDLASKQESIDMEFDLIELDTPVNQLLALYKQREDKVKVLVQLREKSQEIKGKRAEIKKYNKILPAGDKINDLLAIYLSKKQKEELINRLKQTSQKIISNTQQIKSAQKEYDQLHIEFEKAFPSICPLCNKPK